jgi:septal ring factor EnvC (AmiA/AmiB activator)
MKINKTHVLLFIVGGLAIYSLFQSSSIKTDVAGYYRKIDSLQNEIDSVENENKILDNHIATVNEDINKVEGDIINVNKNITVIKNQTHEKVTAVNDYTIHDLLKFFADRYENGLDSTVKSTDGQVGH